MSESKTCWKQGEKRPTKGDHSHFDGAWSLGLSWHGYLLGKTKDWQTDALFGQGAGYDATGEKGSLLLFSQSIMAVAFLPAKDKKRGKKVWLCSNPELRSPFFFEEYPFSKHCLKNQRYQKQRPLNIQTVAYSRWAGWRRLWMRKQRLVTHFTVGYGRRLTHSLWITRKKYSIKQKRRKLTGWSCQ